MCEIEIRGAPIEHEIYQFFVLQVFLQHHVRYYLGDVVLEVVPLLVAVEDGVYSFVGEHGVDVGGIFAFVEVVE